MNYVHIKNDFKQLVREPMMLILFCSPLFIFIFFKLTMVFLLPYAKNYVDFDETPYLIYVQAFVFILVPSMLGIVTGFMMLDERDGKIAELMAVTPLGRKGYLVNRLSFAAVATLIYTFIGYYMMNIYDLPVVTVFIIALLSSSYSMVIGLIIFTIATDKVKGLTYAKGLNIIMLFCLSDLLNRRWLTYLSYGFPTYWITEILQHPRGIGVMVCGVLVNALWLIIVLVRDQRGHMV